MTRPLVIKIGGSLLATPGAMARVAGWLDATQQEGQVRLLIAGGGPAVEGLRSVDRANPLPQQLSHEAAIEIMETNTRLLAAWLPGVCLRRLREIDDLPSVGDHALLLGEWLRDAEPSLPGPRLLPGWETTSDAIAARMAVCWGASLVLLKHPAVKTYSDVEVAASTGIVDPQCARIACGLPHVRVAGLPAATPGIRES